MNTQWHKFKLHGSHNHTIARTPHKRDHILDKYFVFFIFSLMIAQHNLNYVHACRIFNIKYWKWQKTTKTIINFDSIAHKQTDSRYLSFFSVVVPINSFGSYRFYSFWIISFLLQTHTTTTNFQSHENYGTSLETKLRPTNRFYICCISLDFAILGHRGDGQRNFFPSWRNITHDNLN